MVEVLGRKGTATTEPITPTVDDKGNVQFNVTTTATNGISATLFPSIDVSIDFTVTADGKVGIDGGARDGFPSLEIFAYDSEGNVIPIMHIHETEPADLEPPMEQRIPKVEPR